MNEVMILIVVDNECVGCPEEIGCTREACPHYEVIRLYCDCCGEEELNLWYFDGYQWCQDCIFKCLEKVEYEV